MSSLCFLLKRNNKLVLLLHYHKRQHLHIWDRTPHHGTELLTQSPHYLGLHWYYLLRGFIIIPGLMILKIPSISMNYTIFLIIQGDLNKARRSVSPEYYVEIIAKSKWWGSLQASLHLRGHRDYLAIAFIIALILILATFSPSRVLSRNNEKEAHGYPTGGYSIPTLVNIHRSHGTNTADLIEEVLKKFSNCTKSMVSESYEGTQS